MKTYLLPFLTAFAVCLVFLFILLPLLRKLKAGQEILVYVTEHSSKQGTPTMGGIAFIFSTVIVTLIFCGVDSRPVTVALAVFFGYGTVGFLDDFIKIRYRRNMGLRPYQKIIVQLAIAVTVALFVYNEPSVGDKLRLPFSDKQVSLGPWIIPLVIFIYLACTNGVNLTDGLDGLAASTTLCYLVGMFALVANEIVGLESVGDTIAAEQCGNVLILIAVSMGGVAAFLVFNCFPAKVFMGDVGSLALGALVACAAIFTRMSLFIPVLGLMFVVSCLSVIVQVAYFKLTKGKRVFLMAPYHHHLQKKGFSETRISVIYCTVTILCASILLCFGG